MASFFDVALNVIQRQLHQVELPKLDSDIGQIQGDVHIVGSSGEGLGERFLGLRIAMQATQHSRQGIQQIRLAWMQCQGALDELVGLLTTIG